MVLWARHGHTAVVLMMVSLSYAWAIKVYLDAGSSRHGQRSCIPAPSTSNHHLALFGAGATEVNSDGNLFAFSTKLHAETGLYRVSDVFAHDSDYNKFDPDSARQPAMKLARKLIEIAPEGVHQAGSVLFPSPRPF